MRRANHEWQTGLSPINTDLYWLTPRLLNSLNVGGLCGQGRVFPEAVACRVRRRCLTNQFELKENFETKTTNVQYWSDGSGKTSERVTLTKKLDSLIPIEGLINSPNAGLQEVVNAVGVGTLTASIAESSKVDWLPFDPKVFPNSNPVHNPVNIGTAPQGTKPLWPISSFVSKFTEKIAFGGAIFSTGLCWKECRIRRPKRKRFLIL